MNASEERVLHCLFLFECTPTFILYHQNSARWSGPNIGGGGGGVEIFFGGVDILFGGGLAPPAPPRKSVYGVTHFALA